MSEGGKEEGRVQSLCSLKRRSPGEASVLALPWQPSAGQVTVQISGVNAQDHA